MTREFFTAHELSALLGVSQHVVCRAASTGQLPARRVGRRWIFLRSALESWFRVDAVNVAIKDRNRGNRGERTRAPRVAPVAPRKRGEMLVEAG